ncbi:MAG: prolyl oligopeptidase family serine peptidase, partial [Muribaculaceae bacterium]|nr:prolyl oligopeptidase family serine peptidase [Muribaculaceae bacterium]
LTPQGNQDGYQASAPLKRTRNLSTKLLLMHGTADDNVHLQNTLEFVSQLQLDGTLCDMLLFPNMNHSINGCNARAVVYGNMMQYFINNL